jgi:hypothetical protein
VSVKAPAVPLGNPLGTRGQTCCALREKYGPIGGWQETPVILDAADVVEGVGGGDWRRVVDCVELFTGFLGGGS